jgi:hypothetical protein
VHSYDISPTAVVEVIIICLAGIVMQVMKLCVFSASSVNVFREPVLMKPTLILLKLWSSELAASVKCNHHS